MNAETVRVLVEAYGWPGLAVAVALLAAAGAWRLLFRQTKSLDGIERAISASVETQAVHTEVNRTIATEMRGLADRLQQDERDRLRDVAEIVRAIRDARP